MDKNLDEILEEIISGKISVRKACEIYGYKRDFLRTKLVKKYSGDESMLKKIDEVMSNNKINSTKINIDENLLKEVFEEYLDGKILAKEACQRLGIKDKETLRNKFAEFVANSQDKDLKKKYAEYVENHARDYTMINFKLVAIDMIRGGYSQIEMAKMIGGIRPRTISREFEKFKKDEDLTLYILVKTYSDMKMKRHKMTNYETRLQNLLLDKYEREHEDLLEESKKSKTEIKKEEIEEFVFEVRKLESEGLTQKQIAEKLGTSISGIRRAKLALQNQSIDEEEK